MTDPIERQDAINEVSRFIGYIDEDMINRIHIGLKRLPSAKRNGKWIKMSDADGIYWACSKCGEDIPRVPDYNPQFDLFPRLKSIEKTNFCPNCGADMRFTEKGE